ncbi:MAG: CpaF family protein [Selenomonadaceae bacterium]|nr:CpaF family protein [Selenomonadaceae bacterium]
MRSLSLLERLGGKPQDKRKPFERPAFKPEQFIKPKPEPEPKHASIFADEPAESISAQTTETTETPSSSPAAPSPVEASAFAGRRTSVSKQEGVQELKLAIHRRIVDEMTPEEQQLLMRGEEAREQIKNLISAYSGRELSETTYTLTRAERMQLVEDICNELLGLGPLEPLLKDESITEIMVNGPKNIFIEQNGKLQPTEIYFYNDTHLMNIIERILTPLGRRVDESSPLVDARLADGSRVNIIIPPLSLVGPAVTIRKFSKTALAISDLVGFGTLSEDMAYFLQACVKARLNILVSGGTGSGKTTTLNALSSFIPGTDRIVTIEDAAELKLQQRHVVTLEARPANLEGSGAITIRDLVKNSLRMRPDRIIVGEVRAGEALDMLQAMNTGHDGSLTTAHANSPRDVLSRLETMVLMAGMDLPVRAVRTQVASAIDLILQQSRIRDGSRKITHITEVQGMEGDTIILQELFRYVQDHIDEKGRSVGHFEATGLQPAFMDKFRMNGVDLPLSLFSNNDSRGGDWR